MDIAIVGATGNVGRKTLEVLEKKDLSIDNLYLLASSKSLGKKINFKGVDYDIHDLESFDFSKVKICFFAAGGKISEKFAERAAKRQELQNVLTTALKVDSDTKMGIISDIKQELRKVNALKLNYTTRVGDYTQNFN